MQFIFVVLLLISSTFASEIYKIHEKSIKGLDFNLEDLKGKIILIVNIASQCGYTSQLEGLETIYQKYKAKNFIVVGVPTNDFGGQTPEDDKGMMEFCEKNYKVTFPILTKRTIKGENKRELYQFLTQKTPKEFQGEVGWNFEKFLIDKTGQVIGRYGSSVKPWERKFRKDIEARL